MAKTLPLIPMREARVTGPSDSMVLELPEAASQTFKVGALVFINTSGLVEVCAAATTTLLGIALTPGNNAAASSTNKTKVLILSPHSEVLCNLRDNGGAVSYTPIDEVLTQAMVGDALHVQVDSNGLFSLNSAGTSEAAASVTGAIQFTVVQIHPDSAVGDTNAWVYAVPKSANLQHA